MEMERDFAILAAVCCGFLTLVAVKHLIELMLEDRRAPQVRLLSKLLEKATKENLEDAQHTLSEFYSHFRNRFEIPRIFWEIPNDSLIARTLRTLIKVYEKSHQDCPQKGAALIAAELIKFSKRNPEKAMAVMVLLGAFDKDLAVKLSVYMNNKKARTESIPIEDSYAWVGDME